MKEQSSYPEKWTLSTLGELAGKGQYGWTTKASGSGDIKFLRTTDITKGAINWSTVPFCLEEPEDPKKYLLEKGDILISRAGSVGFSALIDEHTYNSVFASYLIRYKPLKGVCCNAFLKHYLSSQAYWRHIECSSAGIALANVNAKNLATLQIPLPPLNEQCRIADKLDTTLAAVEACKQKLNNAAETIKRFRQSVLAAAVSGELTREWREERGITQEWTQATIDSIASVGTGSTPLRSNSSFYAKQGIPWVTSSATSDEFIESSVEYVTQAGIESARLKTYPIGTILVAMYGEGKTRGQVSELKIEATINQACASIHSFNEAYLKEFIKLALKANYLNMRKLAEGGNQPNLNLKKIKTFPIGIPSKEEAVKISERVNELIDQSRALEERIEYALQITENLSTSLLGKAFRGELVPQDPNDEPASVLLERIKAQREAESSTKKPAKRDRKKKADPAQLVIPEGIADNHLANVLEECGALSELALLAASELEPEVFQLQLSKELNGGGLKQVYLDGEAAYADAAWEEEL